MLGFTYLTSKQRYQPREELLYSFIELFKAAQSVRELEDINRSLDTQFDSYSIGAFEQPPKRRSLGNYLKEDMREFAKKVGYSELLRRTLFYREMVSKQILYATCIRY